MASTVYEMPDVNRVVISGELLSDPPLRTTRRGVAVTNFTIVSSRYENQEDGRVREEKSFIRIVAWSALAEHCHRLLRKGSPVVIIGELQSANLSSQEGTESIVQVNAKWIQFPPTPSEQEEAEQSEAQAEGNEQEADGEQPST
ncbi:MAG: single-stranded DNA-binding protein [Calditrichaeota bacterium]|nr:single-stranded DNA-binding protein [Calditrichota bacterium]